MTINIQYVKMLTSETMNEYVKKKLNKLGTKFDWVINANVFFKLENDPKGEGHICEIELSIPGPKIFASSKEKNFELAAKNSIKDLTKQLEKRKASFKKH
ncbi:MAG: ribosome-associated translation inhibitor RaiA [Flavobacteriaceae bacterium]|nr:ribosome-associated translation inhibitor RaiA [Flavobacteriaceae bacterium]|tara:strand:- start:1557 stop:1856 length:300 start_codon:yes stop_codon:yes gene_type:complete